MAKAQASVGDIGAALKTVDLTSDADYKSMAQAAIATTVNDTETISSWKIYHAISKALDAFCPIPKKRK